jgi:hypothetical protein
MSNYHSTHRRILTAMLALLMLIIVSFTGCQHSSQLQVSPIAGRDVVALEAEDIVAIMQRAGFSDSEIIDLGTDLRNSLASRGAARITRDNHASVIVTVMSPYVYVSTLDRGNFIYNSKTKLFQ